MDEWKEKLERRQEERLSKIERKKQERAEQIRPEENPELLHLKFADDQAAIKKILCDLNSLEGNALDEKLLLDDATKMIQKLQKFLSNSFPFLPSYHLKNMQSDIDKLERTLNDKRGSFMPKKKFAFSKKKQTQTLTTIQDTSNQDSTQNYIARSEFAYDTKENTTITGQQITRHDNDLFEKDISFANLQKCTLTLYGSPLALRLEKLESCKVFCGPISGSVCISDCKNCTFVFPCQQLRVHHTVECQFYLYVTSRAIIEDCHGIGFAPFNWKYDGIESHFKASRLDGMKNNWQQVDDFNWLKTEQQSPNWYTISERSKQILWD